MADAATVAVRWNGPVACSAANVGQSAANLKADVAKLYRFYAKQDGCATEPRVAGIAIARHPPNGEHLGR